MMWCGIFPSQGTAPISPLFSRAQFLVCFGAGQQDSSGYSLARGVDAPSRDIPVPLKGADGVVRSDSKTNSFFNEPPRLRALRRLRCVLLMRAATPPFP